jgi:hypothetical protein
MFLVMVQRERQLQTLPNSATSVLTMPMDLVISWSETTGWYISALNQLIQRGDDVLKRPEYIDIIISYIC